MITNVNIRPRIKKIYIGARPLLGKEVGRAGGLEIFLQVNGMKNDRMSQW